jgi:hypothetical protein
MDKLDARINELEKVTEVSPSTGVSGLIGVKGEEEVRPKRDPSDYA